MRGIGAGLVRRGWAWNGMDENNGDMGAARKPDRPLRRGWTTGACATAAVKAAFEALLTGRFPDPVSITLPKGEAPHFPLAREARGVGWAMAAVIKDAGDDPDVTHGAEIRATVRAGAAGAGVVFKAGEGVGMVTKPGLPIPPGEAAINPVPRRMICAVVEDLASRHGATGDLEIEIAIPGGAALAEKTWNGRLGILGGLSILGTTGVVHPFSCAAWIHSIHRGVDVARATGLSHVVGSTGSTSEDAAQALFDLPDHAMLDMGDFAGGLLKYIRNHPVPRLTIAGGFAKLTKLAQGALDLHSGRSQVDFNWLADAVIALGGAEKGVPRDAVAGANTANEVLGLCEAAGLAIADHVAVRALAEAVAVLKGAPVAVDVLIVDRKGRVIAPAR